MYRQEIIKVAVATLNESSVWAVKAQAATVLATIANEPTDSPNLHDAEMLYDTLTSALQSRIWEVKEKLLGAIVALLRTSGKELASSWDETTTEKKFAPLWKECIRKNRKNSGVAVRCASVFCEITQCKKIALQLMAHVENSIKNVDSRYC
ncbi:unnamed protein product [Gongylonema pulchrum]|uniref:Cnd1 domain-containing protein n=1 Tax=Gongylonema pulchrum TaxID=637853 RepID=A0A183DGB2_9BILA|nr:unnamed protein product [Gongylonema pulchrum]